MLDNPEPLSKLLWELWGLVPKNRRLQIKMLMILMILASFAEVLSIGAILPFLGVLTAPEMAFHHPALRWFVQALHLTEPIQLLLPLTIVFCCAALVAGGMRLLLLITSTRISFALGIDLSIDIYRRTLYQPYSVHVGRNSSEIISGISQKVTGLIYQTITPCLTIFSGGIIIIAILITLTLIDPIIAPVACAAFGLIYWVIMRIVRGRLRIDGQRISIESTRVIQTLQEGLGGIRDILLDGTQPVYCDIYRQADKSLRKSQGNALIIGQSPRSIIESLAIILIATLAYFLSNRPDGITGATPVLGAMVLGAQRLLPVLQQSYISWTRIKSNHATLQDTLLLLRQPLPVYLYKHQNEAISFRKMIALNNISFRYSNESPWVLKDIDITISKGDRLGIIGTTGSGKSTLVDLIMALLTPSEGRLEVDSVRITAQNLRSWQAHIAHVPQMIFLADTTIEENIAFGVPKSQIDSDRVHQAAHQAQLASTIEMWPNQYMTTVGERGIRLSGGQRQRLGIARALYKKRDVIIFDEATSALDNETEASLMQVLEKIGSEVTIIMIAHRLTTLRKCNIIIDLDGGRARLVDSYASLVKSRIIS